MLSLNLNVYTFLHVHIYSWDLIFDTSRCQGCTNKNGVRPKKLWQNVEKEVILLITMYDCLSQMMWQWTGLTTSYTGSIRCGPELR